MASKKTDKYLNNNKNLPINVETQWTEDLLTEYKKCKDDVFHFAENYFFIKVLGKGRQKIKLYDPQKEALQMILDNSYTIICASRQCGKSTLMTVICLWYALFKKDFAIAVLANKEDIAKEILERIKLAYEELPNWLKSGVWEFTKEHVKLTNGSKIEVSTTSADAIRGKSIDLLFLDEFAHVRPEIAEDFYKSVIPTITSSETTKLVITSTPKGIASKFYDIFSEAEKGRGGWKFVKIYWHQIPGRDEKWKQKVLALINYDMSLWNQEYDLFFLDNTAASFNGALLDYMKKNCKEPIHTMDNGDYKIWKEPKQGHVYVFGIDTAEGVGQDYSVCQILDITDLTNIEQVAKYYTNRLIPALFAEKIADIIPSWGRPFLCVESNNQAQVVLNDLINVYKVDNIVTHNMKNDREQRYQKPGIFCHGNSKSNGITNLRYWVEHLEAVKFNDIDTVKEFETFVRKENGTWGARKGFRDDNYMALLWALFLLDSEISQNYLEVLEVDDTGKPSRISDPNFDLAFDAFMKGNKIKSFRRTDAEPMPFMYQGGDFGRSSNSQQADEMAGFILGGWRIA